MLNACRSLALEGSQTEALAVHLLKRNDSACAVAHVQRVVLEGEFFDVRAKALVIDVCGACRRFLSESPGLVHELLRRSLGVELPPYADVHRLDAKLSKAAPTEYRSDATASRTIRLGRNNTFEPLVVGPTQIPRVESEAAACAEPELAVLSSIAHAALTNAPTALAVASGLTASRLEKERVAYYIDLIRDLLPLAVQKALESMMIPADYVPRSHFSKRIMSTLAQGRAEGEAAGLLKAIKALLSSHGLHLSPEQTEIVGNCTDLDQLQRWVVLAQHVETTDELFAKE